MTLKTFSPMPIHYENTRYRASEMCVNGRNGRTDGRRKNIMLPAHYCWWRHND